MTAANMLFGFAAIINVFEANFIAAGWLIIIAGILDAFDGKIARKLNNSSIFGKEFDSLADLISFGIAPALLLYQIYFQQFGVFGILITFGYLLFGAYRLARFNALTPVKAKKSAFSGLPITVAGMAVASFVPFNMRIWGEMQMDLVLFPLVAALCLLMVSSITYDSFPRLTFRDGGSNTLQLIILILGLTLIILSPSLIFFPLCLIYIMQGFIRSVIRTFKKQESSNAEDYLTLIE